VRYAFKILPFFLSLVVCHAQTTSDRKPPASSSVEDAAKKGQPAEVLPKAAQTAFEVPTKEAFTIIFDDSNSQLIGIDTSGKVVENVIIAFQLFINIKGVSHSEQALGCFLSKPMLDLLAQAEQNTVLYFEHIQVKNTRGNLVEAKDFQYTLGYLPKQKN